VTGIGGPEEHTERIVIPVTQGGLDNAYISLTGHLGFFPADAVGAADVRDGEGTLLTLHFAGFSEPVLTDIGRRHLDFRRRGPWRKFFERHHLAEGDSVVIERRSEYEYDIFPLAGPVAGQGSQDWDDTEVRAIVADYLEMLSAEAAGQPYSKTEHRRWLQPQLNSARTPQAIEFKHANISAAMIDLGLPYIRGYKPRGNYQAKLVDEIRQRLTGTQLLAALRSAPAPKPAHPLPLQQADRPFPRPRKQGGRHIDYGALAEENRKLGGLGEQLVLAFEEDQLRQAGHDDLADRVRWVARDDGDGLGYDILSFDAVGNERHIEVKTTRLGSETPFYISSAELDFARRHPGSFELYRVYDAIDNPHFFVLAGDITPAVDLVPTTYRAQLKHSTSEPARGRREIDLVPESQPGAF
jgi:hypothetical protein